MASKGECGGRSVSRLPVAVLRRRRCRKSGGWHDLGSCSDRARLRRWDGVGDNESMINLGCWDLIFSLACFMYSPMLNSAEGSRALAVLVVPVLLVSVVMDATLHLIHEFL